MKMMIQGLDKEITFAEQSAKFDQTFEMAFELGSEELFASARSFAHACMDWIWYQWLSETPHHVIQKRVEAFVQRQMPLLDQGEFMRERGIQDLFLLHCAIFACEWKTVRALAKRVVFVKEDLKTYPFISTDRFARAWTGMLKFWILGEIALARAQADIIWTSTRLINFRPAPKPLVDAWLQSDWKKFKKQQCRSFDKMWATFRGETRNIIKESKELTVISLAFWATRAGHTWADNGLALLAFRQGVEVASDPLWLPAHALRMKMDG